MSYPTDNRTADTSAIGAHLSEMHPAAGGHIEGHNQIENDLRALRTKVGIDGDSNTASLDHKVSVNTSSIITNTSGISSINSSIVTARQDLGFAFIASGLAWSSVSGLTGSMTAGTAYSYTGLYLNVAAISSHTFTASKDTWISLSPSGVVTYQEVANTASAPTIGTNYIWVGYVSTNATSITNITNSMVRSSPLGTWQTSTPIWLSSGTQPSIGNGTLVHRYIRLGKSTVLGTMELVIGSTTSVGSGTWTFTFPIVPHAPTNTGITAQMAVGSAYIEKYGSVAYLGLARNTNANTSSQRLSVIVPSQTGVTTAGTPIPASPIGATSPFSWAANDYMVCHYKYEADSSER